MDQITSSKQWGYTKDVFVCDFEITVPKMNAPSDLRSFQLELMKDAMQLLEGLHTLASVNYDKITYQQESGLWKESDYSEDWKVEEGSRRFAVMEEMISDTFFPVIVANLDTTVGHNGMLLSKTSSAELMLSTDLIGMKSLLVKLKWYCLTTCTSMSGSPEQSVPMVNGETIVLMRKPMFRA